MEIKGKCINFNVNDVVIKWTFEYKYNEWFKRLTIDKKD